MHIIWKKYNDDYMKAYCGATLYKTNDGEIFTTEKEVYEYLYNKTKNGR